MPKEYCGYFSHPLDVYEASPEQSPWKIKRKTAVSLVVIIKKKKIGKDLLPA